MNYGDVMQELETLGTAQNRKVYARHGVKEPLFGVSYANLGKLKKKIKMDHELAVALWDSGNHDARVLATMIADPAQMNSTRLEAWVNQLENYGITDSFCTLVARTPLARKKMEKWTRSKKEFVGQAGWQLLSGLAGADTELEEADLAGYLKTIEGSIHTSKNRVRHSMNGALISIGLRSSRLEKMAVAAARRIGKVEVDHGATSCKTPDAIEYIKKAKAQMRKMAQQRKQRARKKTRAA